VADTLQLDPVESLPVAPGQVIADRYLIGSIIGEGGMGIVCSATHVGLGTPVAVKLIRSDLKRDPQSVLRFLNEARTAASLKGEHIARVYDVGQLPTGEPYLVMEQLDGVGLDVFISEHGPLEPTDAVDIVLQVCEGLAEAHAVGLVHRDIKPANLFLERRPNGQSTIKILDFGISKRLLDGPGRGLTDPGRSMGSPWYMSPEQMMNPASVDQRADVWSLGVLLFELLTAAVPFNGETVVQVCASVLTATADPPSGLRAELDPRLDALVMRCLRKRPEERFGSVDELAAALSAWKRGAPMTNSETPEFEGAHTVTPLPARISNGERSLPFTGELPLRRFPAFTIAFCSLLVGAALSWLAWPYLRSAQGPEAAYQRLRHDWDTLVQALRPGDPVLLDGPAALPNPRDNEPAPSAPASSANAPIVTPIDRRSRAARDLPHPRLQHEATPTTPARPDPPPEPAPAAAPIEPATPPPPASESVGPRIDTTEPTESGSSAPAEPTPDEIYPEPPQESPPPLQSKPETNTSFQYPWEPAYDDR